MILKESLAYVTIVLKYRRYLSDRENFKRGSEIMKKRFNTTGVCIPRKHYMVDISNKIDEIEKLVEEEFYFVINRPRQFGKTTTLNELYKRLNGKYSVIRMDFELIGEDFASE